VTLNNTTFNLSAIGFIKTCFPDKFGVPRQSGLVKQTVSELEILPQWQPEFALEGLDGYSHVWLMFIFHLNSNNRYHPKVHPPRLGGQSTGVFATRSPHRPNPIGLSLCEMIKIEKNKIYLSGVDLVDGTPIIDIKPYLPQFESHPEARGGWAVDSAHNVRAIQVEFSEEAQLTLQQWMRRTGRPELEKVIIEVIQQDPRPVVYRGFENTISPYRTKHAFRLYDADIHFEFLNENTALVTMILF